LPDWFPDWSNDICVVVASGPSAKGVDLEPYKDKAKFVVVNNSYQLAPWADVLFAADGRWWNNMKGARDFAGMKVTLDVNASRDFSLNLVRLAKREPCISMDKPGFIGLGGNSGFYALNLALQFGTKKVILVGFDMTLKNGVHWHGPHGKALTNPVEYRAVKWRKMLDEQAKKLRQMGVEVINASETSALVAYPKMKLSEAMEKLK
jgi:hypothetical protein